MKSAFNQVRMHEDSIKYTSFVTPLGQYEFLKMPFGLKIVPQYFSDISTRFFATSSMHN